MDFSLAKSWKKIKKVRRRIASEMLNGFTRPIFDAWYWFRTHTYNRYHIVNCKSPANGYRWGWQDRSQLLLYASFNILKDFVEKEYPGYVDWNYDEPHRKARDEFLYLHKWWTEIRPAQVANTHDCDQDKEDQEHLLRLMAIREFLWT